MPSIAQRLRKKPQRNEAFWFWFRLGFISFGGPAGQIALMHEELVEKRRWISEERFLHALNYCMLLPGPEAQQLSIYIGWLLHGVRGGLVAGIFFVLPSVVILGLLSWLYVCYGALPFIAALFAGLKPAVVAIVAGAAARIGRKALRSPALWTIAALAFASLFFLQAPFPVIVVGAAAIGWMGGWLWPAQFTLATHAAPSGAAALPNNPPVEARFQFLPHALRVMSVGLLLWWTPVAILFLALDPDHAVVRQSFFFSKAALITFGGAYAVLPYVSQEAVTRFGWLNPGQMLDGLGLAETTPGPLIMVLQFVGFVGAYGQPGGLPPLASGILGGLITTWTTFAPSFIFIFLGAPWIERLRHRSGLNAALSAVTAAVVGVILNLALWFGLHVLYSPATGLKWPAVILTTLAYLAITSLRWNIMLVVALSALLGLLAWLAGGPI